MAYISTTADPYALICVHGVCAACECKVSGTQVVFMAWGVLCERCNRLALGDYRETPPKLGPYDPRTEMK